MSHDEITRQILAAFRERPKGQTMTPAQIVRAVPRWAQLNGLRMDVVRRHLRSIEALRVVEPANGAFAERWGETKHHTTDSHGKVHANTAEPGLWERCKRLREEIASALRASDGLTCAQAAAMFGVDMQQADGALRKLAEEGRAIVAIPSRRGNVWAAVRS